MTTSTPVKGSAAAAHRRFTALWEEYQFMRSFGMSPNKAAERIGVTLPNLRLMASRRGLQLPDDPDTVALLPNDYGDDL